MRSIVIASLLFTTHIAFAQNTYGDASAFPGWSLDGLDGQRFAAVIDNSVTLDHKPAGRLSTSDNDAKFGSLSQTVDAMAYRDKRVRFSVTAKTEGVKSWAGIWLRVEGADNKMIAFENTESRALRGDTNWTPIDIVLDVPAAARNIHFGVGQDGPGTLWFGRVNFQVVDSSVALSKKGSKDTLRNGDFEASTIGDWFLSGGGRRNYTATTVKDVKHGGKQAVKLTLAPGGDATKTLNLMQYIDPKNYIGQRVRASIWLRSDGVTKRGSFWVRADGIDTKNEWPGLGGGWYRVDPTSSWQQHTVVFDVATETVQIVYGIELSGPGELWADDATFEIVPRDTPLQSGAPTAPRNLDFSTKH